MRFGKKKAQNQAPADPNLPSSADDPGATPVASKRSIRLPSVRLPGIYPTVVALGVVIITLTVGVCVAIATGNSQLVTPLLALDGGLAVLAMICCVVGAANGAT
ncbi:MAG: hypothetical protein HZB70_01750 [Candidatus Berkelbacteria bacterium]|nr:MAG: hypothetical protein HZB70_01750 [Candidatus Berkelbacteria bacterium]QQG51948.1 MAG: hypothetical protein HY845_01245 [Candidatus Berkelbacteria bacterium]